jgi:porin
LAIALAAAAPGCAIADDATLTGDWGGTRRQWADAGVSFRGDYVSETFAAVDGGLKRGRAYAQQVRMGVDADLERLSGWNGAIFHFTLNDRRGVGISSDYVGNRLPIQEDYGGLYTRLTEFSLEQNLVGGQLNLRLGFFAMGNDLGGIALGCNFVNAAFCAHPLSLSGNSGWYNYPNARWGAALRYKLRPDLLLRSGVFQVNAKLGDKDNAFKPFAAGTTGVLLPLELEYAPEGGHYKLGMYYDTSRASRQGGSGTVDERYGVYVLAEQMIIREGRANRGLSLFGQYTAHPETSAPMTRWYAVGVVKTGTFEGRDADSVALGVVRAEVNPRLRMAHVDSTPTPGGYASLPAGESAIELAYGWQLRRWLSVRANLQYIVDPGAFSYRSTANATALGVQVRITF